jgi:hypothetical protein
MTRTNDFLRMEHRFKRDPDTWQDFLPKKSNISVIFGERDTIGTFSRLTHFSRLGRRADTR